ncbi:MAG: iron-containing alcohol dehydrogenase family protein [Gemmataceae bacterium]
MTQIRVPTLVRSKPGALDRLGIYLTRPALTNVVFMTSEGLPQSLVDRAVASMKQADVNVLEHIEISQASFEVAQDIFKTLPKRAQAIVGCGGGKALDVAKYISFLAALPFYAVPTSLSNDGFCSPQSSLTVNGHRKSLPSKLPYAVVIDTKVCLSAPNFLWWSGVGDLVAKVTAVADWKLAFHAKGEPVNDFAALLSDATVFQFMAQPTHDEDGMRLLGTALTLNGIAMEICGSSRPASGSEHLISHALDGLSSHPKLHGLQVGVATYIVSNLQGQGRDRVASVLDKTRFWDAFEGDPCSVEEWLEAVHQAPKIKEDFYTVLSSRDCLPEVKDLLTTDERLKQCFR